MPPSVGPAPQRKAATSRVSTALRWWRKAYGEHPLHLVVLALAFALAAYTVSVVGFQTLWNPQVWWQAIGVWFAAAIIAHDLVLYPVYALADRILTAATARTPRHRCPLNYLRLPLIGIAATFVLFFPGILQQGADTFHAATGQSQQPFLGRWLWLSAAMLLISALAYVLEYLRTRRSHSGKR